MKNATTAKRAHETMNPDDVYVQARRLAHWAITVQARGQRYSNESFDIGNAFVSLLTAPAWSGR